MFFNVPSQLRRQVYVDTKIFYQLQSSIKSYNNGKQKFRLQNNRSNVDEP